MLPVAKVFLDTSVIFAAVLSPNGGARMVFRLGEVGYLQLMAGKQVLKECETVVRRKAPQTLPELAILLDVVKLTVTPEASNENLERARLLVSYPPDALILAEAIHANPDWFLSHDHQHLLKVPADALPFRIGTPGDLLNWLKSQTIR
ncbi:MAG: PIN domain-containing protein [Chloroflexota bacterium]|nr:MAG: hypothetical protein KatS3mg045_1307 [Bellilinea sp.]